MVLLLLFLTACYVCYCIAYRTTKKERANDAGGMITNSQHYVFTDEVRTLISDLRALKYERVYINSSCDGVKLSARYYHQKDGAPVDILCHGYRGTAFRDFCGGHKLCREMGHNILLIDQRGHGESESNVITFGVKERHDVVDWAKYVADRFPDAQIMLYGISMGGTSVLMASELDLPKQVKGIAADCPFTSPKAILRRTISKMPPPKKWGYPFAIVSARLFGGFSLSEASAADAVKNAKVPILIIHGEDDDFVPCEMGREIAENGKDITFVTFPGATHGVSYMTDGERYKKTVHDFCERVLN